MICLVALPACSSGEESFCSTALQIGTIPDGSWYAYQDQSTPGPDQCDYDLGEGDNPFPPPRMVGGIIGFDCRLYLTQDDEPDTTVMLPNRGDGTCGMPDE